MGSSATRVIEGVVIGVIVAAITGKISGMENWFLIGISFVVGVMVTFAFTGWLRLNGHSEVESESQKGSRDDSQISGAQLIEMVHGKAGNNRVKTVQAAAAHVLSAPNRTGGLSNFERYTVQ